MRIKNWPTFQHFKNRRPPWIKLYRDLLDDKAWHLLSPLAAKILVMLWLLASEDTTKTGTLPSLEKMAFRLRLSEATLMRVFAQLSHWVIELDITMISPRYQLGPSETETETETETEGEADDITMISRKRVRGIPTIKRAIQTDDRPTDRNLAFAKELGIDAGPEWGKFKHYCLAHDKRYANFESAFRNWLAREKEKRYGSLQRV